MSTSCRNNRISTKYIVCKVKPAQFPLFCCIELLIILTTLKEETFTEETFASKKNHEIFGINFCK